MKKLMFLASSALASVAVFAQEVAAEVANVATNAAAGATETAAEAAKEISALDQWILYFQQGGATMYFIGALSILGIGCALERFWNMKRAKIVPDELTGDVIKLWKAGKFEEVANLCAKDKSMLARVIETILQHKDSKDYNEVKQFAEDKIGRELRLENRKSAMLSTAASLSPLLGLFGTVLGLLGAFGTVAAMGEMGDASVLADDIGKALITTVAGLAVSMPCLFVYGIIKNRLNLFAVLLEEEVADLVNQLFVKK